MAGPGSFHAQTQEDVMFTFLVIITILLLCIAFPEVIGNFVGGLMMLVVALIVFIAIVGSLFIIGTVIFA